MLKECLNSIRNQTFSNYEVIIGNDYISVPININELGIDDSRITIVNYPQNLGEINNMNALLRMSQGRYFTWLADDDMYSPFFLESIHNTLIRFDFPSCVFSSYCHGDRFPERIESHEEDIKLFNGQQFLQLYLSREITTIGCYGVFDKKYIELTGGIEKLGNKSFHPYSDNLLAIKAGLLNKLVYIDTPLIFYRTHEGSISSTSPDLNAYQSAQQDLCKRSIPIFRSLELKDDFKSNLFYLLMWCIKDFIAVVRRAGSINFNQTINYLIFQVKYIGLLRGSIFFRKAISVLFNNAITLLRNTSFGKKNLKLIISNKILSIKSFIVKLRFSNNERAVKKYTYIIAGRKPWNKGYNDYKEDFLKKVLVNHKLIEKFRQNQELPKGYGFRLDERVIEYPWMISRLTDRPTHLLDAGSALNHSYLLNLPFLKKKLIVIYALATDDFLNLKNISYIHGDLREIGLKEQVFEEIICISTLEHIGLDNTKIYIKNEHYKETKLLDYRRAILEFWRLLTPGGKLLITVPFGRYQNLGWLQQFDFSLLKDVIKIFKGNIRDQTFYQYKSSGWIRSNLTDCQDCEYFDIHSKSDYDPDYVAAARAVACLELIK